MARTLKKLLSLVLVAALFVSVVPTQAFAAEETEIYLPEIEIGNDILDYDLFYLATAAASVQEGGNHAYLLRVGRGGSADSESTALIKIADMTAKYGEDYVVRVRDERTKVDNPKDNFSLMEMMEGSDFEQGELGTEDELAGMLENDPEAREAYTEGLNTALEFLEEASGFDDKYGDENPYAEAVEEIYGGAEWDAGAIPANGDGETLTIGGSADAYSDPLRQAVNFFTGQDAAPQRLTAEGDMFQDLQAIANVMTNVVVGASVELTFAPGETEKYLEIVPRDNRTGDGDRMFYIILGAPGGTTTNSAASSCAFTIEDDEEQEPAVVSFSDAVYHADSESVTVTVERSGAMNTVISTKIVTTGEGTAQAGRDYSEVDAELVFPFGVDHLSLDIPVRTEYLTGEGSFGLALEPEAGCSAGENDTATVYLGGSYTGKASFYAARKTRMLSASDGASLMAADGSQASAVDINNLQTVKLGTALDVSKPNSHGHWQADSLINLNFTGNDRWVSSWNCYQMEWIHKYGAQGTVHASWRLWGETYWASGFQMNWQHGGGHTSDQAWVMVAVSGNDDRGFSWGDPYYDTGSFHAVAGRGYKDFSYEYTKRFSPMTMNFYPSKGMFDDWNGWAPYRISVYNKGSCDNCDPVYIYSIAPILRPFQIAILDPERNLEEDLQFLKADGSRGAVPSATTTKASIVGAESTAVRFMDESFTVATPSGSNVAVYGYMKALNWVDAEGRKIATLAQNRNTASTSIEYKLTKDNINSMGRAHTEEFRAMLQDLPDTYDASGNKTSYGRGNYARMYVKPEFDYINSSVILRNPYDFPVTMTISGTDYTLEAKETRKIRTGDGQDFHLGDMLEVSKITLGDINSDLFAPVGVYYEGKKASGGQNVYKGTLLFDNGNPVRVSGSNDDRLLYQEVVIEPRLQDNNNRIVVRVKTDELAFFDTESDAAGLLGQAGTVDGAYTYFTYADTAKTVSGKLYGITVTPLSDGTVATWYDANTHRTYVGNTLYFTAGSEASRNIITLSSAKATDSVTLHGTLKYSNYNLRTGFSGNASSVPAIGAVLSAGSAGGVANTDGFVTAGPIPITGFSDQYLRYIVSVNGTDLVKELLLPTNADAAVTPSLLWDFNSDNAANAIMGHYRKNLLTYVGETDGEGNDYYTFTATGGDPFVSMDTPVDSVDSIQWMKVRARNLSSAKVMELYACKGTNTNVNGNTCTQISLEQDTEWHEYVIHIPTANVETANAFKGANLSSTSWTGNINWIRLDPMANVLTSGGGVTADSQIQIDYIAFFPTEAEARSFVNRSGPTVLYDFGSDNAASSGMGKSRKNFISYRGEKDSDGNDYYTFTVDGPMATVSLDNVTATDARDIQWVKVRARHSEIIRAPYESIFTPIEMYFFLGEAGGEIDYKSSTSVELAADTEWHEYVFNLPENCAYDPDLWSGSIDGVILGPTSTALGSKIQIDYLAFFPNEEAARSFEISKNSAVSASGVIDISTNFPDGVSPVTSDIFRDITITGTMSDPAYQINNNAYIPVVLGEAANMTITIKPKEYTYSITGQDGQVIEKQRKENPVSVQLVVYDRNDVFRGLFEAEDTFEYDLDEDQFIFRSRLDFVEPEEVFQLLDENGDPVYDKDGEPIYVYHDENGDVVVDENGDPIQAAARFGLVPNPGDKLYIRLVTNRLAQTRDLTNPDNQEIYKEYQYSDVFTGMSFVQPLEEAMPKPIGIDNPVKIEYGDLPFVGSTGMNMAFPFVTVGIMHIHHGYRLYIGVSPVQIMDTIKGSHLSSMSGAGGEYWKSLFSMGSPIESFKNGISTAADTISMYSDAAKDAKANHESFSAMSLGSPSWKFDLSVGMYFDFLIADVSQADDYDKIAVFSGMGGYVSITLGFSMAWYVMLPVVFLPAYLGIEITGTVMGFLGADLNKNIEITYDSVMHGNADINSGIASLNGAVRGLASAQISFGVGLCGTLGVRLSGKVDIIANWEPNDPHGDTGAYIALSVGGLIDLFLFSIPLMFNVGGWPFGSFEYYANPESETVHSNTRNSAFMLREGSGEDSVWLGDQMLLQGAFRPNKQKEAILAVDPYERPDSQLITLSDGKTLALAFIDSDSRKDVTQRTTLKLSIYDADMGLWSEPVPVAGDNTADFQPSIGQMKDGRLLVAWVSTSDDTITDVSTDEQAMKYLESMDVYTAFVELDENKQIRTKNDPIYGVSADTEVTRITNDRFRDYYDANPTVVCDMETGDAIVYYIKSERVYIDGDEIGEYINPYTNDSVVSYMIYSAQGVEVTKTKPGAYGAKPETETITEHWLFDYYYPGERDHNTADMTEEEAEMAYAMLISLFGGQRFLDGPVNNKNERYAIPDFTAIGFDGMSVCAYTIDPDGTSDTDADKELYLQAYDFRNHRTKYQTILTSDGVSDTLPQLFRSRVNTEAGPEAHAKLFWYRDGKQVVYIDVTELLDKGINADGTLKQKADGTTYYTYTDEQGEEHTVPDTRDYIYTDSDGRTHSRYTDPCYVYVSTDDSHAFLQAPDFRAVEDSRGNLYILWTEGMAAEDGNTAREIFGTGLVSYESGSASTGETAVGSSGWSKPYQITDDGFHNDELAVAMSGDNLITVHNRYREELVSVPEGTEYNGQVDFMPLRISDMALVAETLEPCGSVETESIRLYGADGAAVTLPNGGDTLTIEVEVSNNGMNTAQGYKLSLYADDTPVGEIESTDALVPNSHRTHTFQYTLPADVEGLTFKAVAQEMRDAEYKIYYRDTDTYIADPLEARAAYEISGVETYQSADGFHAAFTVTNTGNAPSSGEDTLNVKLRGPANLGDLYTDALYSGGISLAVGESKDFDVPVAILPEMMEDFGFVTALITVQKEVVEQTVGNTELKGLRYLSNLVYADFDLVVPMNMELQDVNVAVDSSAEIAFAMRLGDKFGSGNDSVTYAVDDLTVAKVENGKVVGVNGGETALHATHTATGATVSATVTVTGEREKPDLEIMPTAMSLKAGDTDVISCSTPHEGDLTFTSSDPRVVIVDENGKVTAVGAGTATITVTLTDAAGNTYTKTMTVTVSAPVMPVIPTPVVPSPADPSPAAPDPGEAEPCDGGDGCLLSAFDDLDPTAWYHDGVHWALENGIMNGYGDGRFGPNDTTTRAMIVTMLYRLEGSPMIRSGMPFDDVTEEDWYAMAVSWAESKGIVTGYGDGKFGPNDVLTREQFATILYRYAKMKGLGFTGTWAFQLSFDDASEVSDWAYEAICWMTMQGIINGVGDNMLSPKGSATRAQVATMLMRFEAIEQ